MAKITVTQLLGMDDYDIYMLPDTDLRAGVRALQKSISQRVRRLEKAGLAQGSPALQEYKSAGGLRTTRDGKKLDSVSLRNEIARGLQLLQRSTLTISGARRHKSAVEAQIPVDEMDEETRGRFWDTYHRYKELNKSKGAYSKGSDVVRAALEQVMSYEPTSDHDELLKRLDHAVNALERGATWYWDYAEQQTGGTTAYDDWDMYANPVRPDRGTSRRV